MPTYLTLLEASKKLNISVDTLRRWDKGGLIKSTRNELNYRIFNEDEISRLYGKYHNVDDNVHEFKTLLHKQRSAYTVVELFAGCGGTALGFHNAGLNHNLLVEYDKACVSTLKTNMPDWNIIENDIRQVSFEGIQADIVEGGFPCQSFSYAGKKRGFEDTTRGTLFFEFARAVKEIRPKIAVAENVRGLENHDGGKTLETMLLTLKELGYTTEYKVLKAQYFDVPQKRERLIIIAVRNDLNIPIIFPKENDYIISLREALKNVPQSIGQKYSEEKKRIMDLIPPGGYWRNLPIHIQQKYMGASYNNSGGKTGMARRMAWSEPCLTLTTSPSQKQTERCHPDETRPFTVREYARIQSFPDEWSFFGGITSQYKQIGNAVPVNLSYHLGRSLIKMLDQINI